MPPFYEMTWRQMYRAVLFDDLSIPNIDIDGNTIPHQYLNAIRLCLLRSPSRRLHSAIDVLSLISWKTESYGLLYPMLIRNKYWLCSAYVLINKKEGVSKLKFPFWNVIVWYYNNGKAIFTPCFQGKYGLFLACETNLLINCKLVNPKIEFWHSPFIL